MSDSVTAIVVALPREVEGLVKNWKHEELPDRVHLYTNGEAVVACAGMGEARAVLAARAAMSRMNVTCLISAGLAGAASPRLRVGDIVWPGLVIDGETGERFEGEGSQPVLVTVNAIASKAEKTRLQAKYFADVIDMEAVGVARVAREHGLEFRAVKAVSDDATFELEATSRFVTKDGQFREGAFVGYAAVRPWMWGPLLRLAQNSAKAVNSLKLVLEAELAGYEQS